MKDLKMGRYLEGVVKNAYGCDQPVTHFFTDEELVNEELRPEWVVERRVTGKDLRPMWVAYAHDSVWEVYRGDEESSFCTIPCTLKEGMDAAKKRRGGVYHYRVRNLRTRASILAEVL